MVNTQFERAPPKSKFLVKLFRYKYLAKISFCCQHIHAVVFTNILSAVARLCYPNFTVTNSKLQDVIYEAFICFWIWLAGTEKCPAIFFSWRDVWGHPAWSPFEWLYLFLWLGWVPCYSTDWCCGQGKSQSSFDLRFCSNTILVFLGSNSPFAVF